jgi:hypothetical protein
MRVPQVSERIKEAPAQALRGVFAGIGQLLLVTDKLRNKTPASAGVPRTRAPEAADPAAAPAAAAPTAAGPAAADSTPAPDADVKPEAVKPEVVVVEPPAAAEAVAAEAVAAEAVAAEPAAAEPAAAAPAKAARATARKSPKKPPARDFDKTGNVRLLAGEQAAEAAASDVPAVLAETPPLPSYDELSIASLRARLRNLDIPQLKQVADYERSHLGRAEVIVMFERRVAKLEAEQVAKLEAEPEAGA